MNTEIIGHTVIEADCLSSTNTTLMEMAVKGCIHGTVLTAREQKDGRGSRGSSWYSERDRSFCGSVYLNPGTGTETQFILNMAIASAVADCIGSLCHLKCEIKWPNDLFVMGRKTGGILVENVIQGARLQHVVAGIGVNLNIQDFPDGLEAASLSRLNGNIISQKAFTKILCEKLNIWYGHFLNNPDGVLHFYNQNLFGKNKLIGALVDGKPIKLVPLEAITDGSLKVILDQQEKIMNHGQLRLMP